MSSSPWQRSFSQVRVKQIIQIARWAQQLRHCECCIRPLQESESWTTEPSCVHPSSVNISQERDAKWGSSGVLLSQCYRYIWAHSNLCMWLVNTYTPICACRVVGLSLCDRKYLLETCMQSSLCKASEEAFLGDILSWTARCLCSWLDICFTYLQHNLNDETRQLVYSSYFSLWVEGQWRWMLSMVLKCSSTLANHAICNWICSIYLYNVV